MALAIRDAATDGGDEDFILALNAACTPAVSDMSREDLREISAAAHRVLVAETTDGPCGFVILLRPAPRPIRATTTPGSNSAFLAISMLIASP